MAVKLHTDCAATKLVSTNSGQCQFFTHVMEKLDEQQFGVFVIGKKDEGAGGYFTEKKLVTRIVLPEGTATYDEVNNTISFPADKEFAIFVHEASHFLHIVVDKGHYMAKPLRGMEDISINSKDFLEFRLILSIFICALKKNFPGNFCIPWNSWNEIGFLKSCL